MTWEKFMTGNILQSIQLTDTYLIRRFWRVSLGCILFIPRHNTIRQMIQNFFAIWNITHLKIYDSRFWRCNWQKYLFSGTNFTTDNCPDEIVDEDYFTDPDLTINCKLVAEILPKWLKELQTCTEDFPPYGRLVYSSSSMIIQYLLPTITISVAYYQIYGQLKIRLNQKVRQLQINNTPAANGGPAIPNSNLIDRMENDIRKMRRTIYLLISMGLVFCVCWLPLNIFNTVSNQMLQQCNLGVTMIIRLLVYRKMHHFRGSSWYYIRSPRNIPWIPLERYLLESL